MGIPYDVAACPTCGGVLKKPPQKKTKCPHCSDFIYVKYRPNQDHAQRQIVGSEEAEQIDAEWTSIHEARRQQYIGDAQEHQRRVLSATYPARVHAFHVQYVEPLRDGDVIATVYCHDKQTYPRIVDLVRWCLVTPEQWWQHRKSPPVTAPIQALIRPLVDGAGIRLVDPSAHVVISRSVEIPDDWREPWPLRAPLS